MEKVNLNDFVKQYLEEKEKYSEDPEYSRNFMRNILDMKKVPFSVKLKIFAKFFELAEERYRTTDFRFFGATSAIYDVLSEEKFI